MNSKKGFTLIELTISLVLLSVVLIFVLNFYNIIRNNESNNTFESKLELNKSLIASNLYKDIYSCGGISDVTCDSNSCIITLNNNQKRKLELSDPLNTSYKKLKYINETNNEIIYSRDAIDGYNFNIEYEELTTIHKIVIKQWNDVSYQIEIVSKK